MMDILKLRKSSNAPPPDNSRRSFIWKLGAGASAAMVATVATAKADTRTAQDPSVRLALLDEEQALRKFHQAFEQAMDRGAHEQVIGMFAEDGEVVFNNGIFSRRSHGVSRLYRDRFPAGQTGRRMQPAPGFELGADRQQGSLEVSADRRAAQGVFPYSIQVGMPLETESSLGAMARLHGEGVWTWWEGGVYRVDYRRSAGDGRWQIRRLE